MKRFTFLAIACLMCLSGCDEAREMFITPPNDDEFGQKAERGDTDEVEDPTKDEPTTDEPVTDEPTTDEPTTDEPVADDPKTCTDCAKSETCVDGECVPLCSTGYVYCDDHCYDMAALHLAGCNQCEEGYCDGDDNYQNGCEISSQGSDNNNCGKCGMTCPVGTKCTGGACYDTCASDEVECNGVCMNLNKLHMSNCTQCAANYCNNDGILTNGCEIYTLGSDNSNCGGCSSFCPTGTACSAGVCVTQCSSGEVDCDGICRNLNKLHLASCTTCAAGYCDSDGNISNGCEIYVNGTDVNNCGACNKKCAAGQVCTNGACITNCGTNETVCGNACLNFTSLHLSSCTACAPNYCDKDNNKSNGCEINAKGSDVNNCGGCGVKCASGQTCNGGSCVTNCQSGQQLCGASCLNLSSLHLSSCTACAPNYCDKDNNKSNGCEINAKGSDVNNCGGCGVKCASGQTCNGGTCVTPETGNRVMVITKYSGALKVYSSASTGSSALGSLENYEYVTAFSETNGFYRIKYNGKDGYIQKAYTMDACDKCASRKAIDLAEKYLYTKTGLCTFDFLSNNPKITNFTDLSIYGSTYNYGYDCNCANFVTAILKTLGLISQKNDIVGNLLNYCRNGNDGYRLLTDISQAKPGDIWINRETYHAELVVGYHDGYLVLIGSNNFGASDGVNNCKETHSSNPKDYQRVSYGYSDWFDTNPYVLTRQ